MKKKRTATKRFFLLIFAALFLYVGVIAFSQWKEYRQIQQMKAAQEEKIREAERKIQSLKNTIEFANTPEFIESLAREKLGWVKKGETRYVLNQDP